MCGEHNADCGYCEKIEQELLCPVKFIVYSYTMYLGLITVVLIKQADCRGPCLIGFVDSRVITCGLEMAGRQDRDTKEINRVATELGAQLSEYRVYPYLWKINISLIYPDQKGDKKARDSFSMIQKNKQSNYLFNT